MRFSPFTTQIPNRDSFPSESWNTFFRELKSALDPLGVEKSFELVNNLAVAADVEGLTFSSRGVSQVIVDYLIQRITSTTELIESGTFHLVYRPTVDSWEMIIDAVPEPDDSGVTLTVTNEGAVQYTTTNVGGTASISKMTFRARTLAAKNYQYSEVGR